MDYRQTLDYLYSSTPVFEHVGAKAYKPGLQTSMALDGRYGHPHRNFKIVHVAGTNGKGSCSHTIAAILQAEGHRVGLYTSPHLVDFKERIRVNGECIEENYVTDFVERDRDFFESLRPSFFELATALAFKYFSDKHVDIAVIEVGLGGRLDCTNIVTPILSIITNISKDHTLQLGDTLQDIAGEKAGIIKKGVPVVIGESDIVTRPVFEQKAREMSATAVFAEDTPEIVSAVTRSDGKIMYETRHYGSICAELNGDYQVKNANTILHAVDLLAAMGLVSGRDSVCKGFGDVCRTTGIMGRWQKLQDRPLVICDTGHNVGGWQYLSRQIAMQPCKTLRIVFGMVDDKDIRQVLTMLPRHAVCYFTNASTHRAIPSAKVAQYAASCGLHGSCHDSVSKAYMAALADASADDFVFVGGSSYVVADLLLFLEDRIKSF